MHNEGMLKINLKEKNARRYSIIGVLLIYSNVVELNLCVKYIKLKLKSKIDILQKVL
jgi:hypothetical protein